MARELSLEGRARERFLALPHCQNCSCENLFQEVPCQLKLTPELSRTGLRPRRCDNYSTAPRPRSGLGLNELLGTACDSAGPVDLANKINDFWAVAAATNILKGAIRRIFADDPLGSTPKSRTVVKGLRTSGLAWR